MENQAARKHFREIILLPKDYAWRAAWLLKSALSPNDNYDDFSERAIALLPAFKEGHQREVLKLLEHLPLKESL